MRALLLLTLLAACYETNPNYCPGHPDNNCNIDPDGSMPQACTTSSQCSAGKPICEPAQKVCVACTDTDVGACSGTTPVCSANACTGCTAHGQCASDACLPTGACVDEATIAYVNTGGSDGACTKSAPCGTIAQAAATGRPYIKLLADVTEAVVLTNANVTILGDDMRTVRRPSGDGPVFDLHGTSTVTIRDLVIRGGNGTTGHGVNIAAGEPVSLTLDRVYVVGNNATGIVAQGGSLAMSRCIVSGNLAGGANISTTFNITNSIFVANGGPTMPIGGLMLAPPSAASTFRFNTVANNASNNAFKGINCALPLTVSNTIMWMNEGSSGCTFEYSLFDTNVTGTGNRMGSASFKNTETANPLAADYFRIGAASDAVDHGDPASTMNVDIDGDSRPKGNAPDIGADELN